MRYTHRPSRSSAGASGAAFTATFFAFAACLLAASPATAEVVELDAAAQARAGILVRPVLERAFGDQVRVVGQVARSPGAEVTVKSILDGRVEKILATPGDAVRAGQALLTLHSHELHRLQGELLRAHEALALAETRVEAGEQLFALEGISRLELQQRRQEALALRLELDSVRAELEDLGYKEEQVDALIVDADPHPLLTLRAPAAGVVLSLAVEQHAWVRAYDPLLVIGDPEALELLLQMPPDEAGAVRPGDVVEFVPVGRPEEMGRARVTTRVPQVDPATRTVTLRAAIEESRALLLPGVFVEGMLTRGEAVSAPSVPEGAVTRIGTADYVFVRQTAERFEARPVKLGRFNGSRYEIVDGVAPGEEVAVDGVFLLKSALVRGGEGEEG